MQENLFYPLIIVNSDKLELVHKFMNLMLFKAWITVMRTMCFEHFRLMYTNTLQRRTHTPNKTNPSQGSVEHV